MDFSPEGGCGILFRKRKLLCGIVLGISVGIILYMLLPANWILLAMCAVIIYISILILRC